MNASCAFAPTGSSAQVSSGDPNPAAAGDDDPRQAPNSRGLARAIRPDQSEHLPGSNPERQPLDGGEVAIQLLQPLDFDHWPPRGRALKLSRLWGRYVGRNISPAARRAESL